MYDESDLVFFDPIGFLSMVSVFLLAVILATIPAYLYSLLAQYAFVAYDAIKYPIGLISFFIAFKLFRLYPKIYLVSAVILTFVVGLLPMLNYITMNRSTIEEISIIFCGSLLIWALGYKVIKLGYSDLKDSS